MNKMKVYIVQNFFSGQILFMASFYNICCSRDIGRQIYPIFTPPLSSLVKRDIIKKQKLISKSTIFLISRFVLFDSLAAELSEPVSGKQTHTHLIKDCSKTVFDKNDCKLYGT